MPFAKGIATQVFRNWYKYLKFQANCRWKNGFYFYSNWNYWHSILNHRWLKSPLKMQNNVYNSPQRLCPKLSASQHWNEWFSKLYCSDLRHWTQTTNVSSTVTSITNHPAMKRLFTKTVRENVLAAIQLNHRLEANTHFLTRWNVHSEFTFKILLPIQLCCVKSVYQKT